jgi:hypothetical protein
LSLSRDYLASARPESPPSQSRSPGTLWKC